MSCSDRTALHKQAFPHRYAPNWHSIRTATFQATGGKCTLCRCKARQIHHVRYGIWDGSKWVSTAGKERPLVDVFPLCLKHHKEAHLPQNWVWNSKNPELGNRNQAKFVKRLRSALIPVKKSLSVLHANARLGRLNVVKHSLGRFALPPHLGMALHRRSPLPLPR